LVSASAENAKAVFAALAELGAPLQGLTAADMPIGIAILTSISGIEFDAAWGRPVEDVIDPATGLKANFISREDLMATKLASGRRQDLRRLGDSQG
jgi:hypothetical protein